MRPDLAALVTKWQALLKLRDWRLDVDYVPNLAAPDGAPVYGLCSPFVDGKRARISIRDPETPVRGAEIQDPEDTLVHELLHLHFAPLAENTTAGVAAEEQAVWAITEAFAAVKATPAAARLARAFVAVAQGSSPRPRRERKQGMDPIMLAALKAAASAEDPKAALDALLAQLESGGDAPPGDVPATAEPPPADDDDPPAPMQAAPAPRTARPAAAPVPAAPAARRAVVPASGVVSRREFDRFRVASLLDKRDDLNEVQRTFAADLPFEQAEKYLKTIPAGIAAVATPPAAMPSAQPGVVPPRAQRPTTPTQGEHRATRDEDVLNHIDRRMGIPQAPTQTVTRDQRTGRLTISSLQPIVLKKGGE